MAAQKISDKDLFTAYRKIDSVKDMVELTKMSDDQLYELIGRKAQETMSSLKPGSVPEVGDTTGKAPFMYREVPKPVTFPAVYLDLPQDAKEAGKVVFDQLQAAFDKILCEMVSKSPLYGYKQEEMTLGTQCAVELSSQFPQIDKGLLQAFVALRTKQHFNTCTRW